MAMTGGAAYPDSRMERAIGANEKRYLAEFYPESEFGGFTDIDGTVAFYSRVNALVDSSFQVVDFGCGRGSHVDDPIQFRSRLRSLKGKVNSVVGLDIDSRAAQNSFIDEFRPLGTNGKWPVGSDSSNLVICDFVIEHLPDPNQFFREATRVLADGGYICIRTPNIFSYFGVLARIIPEKRHRTVLKAAQPARREEDVFPAFYRCNTVRALRRQLTDHGFRSAVYAYEAEPSYHSVIKFAYRIGVLHQRLAPRCVRPTIFAFAQLSNKR